MTLDLKHFNKFQGYDVYNNAQHFNVRKVSTWEVMLWMGFVQD
jgi:hypothetical protein